MLDFNKAKIYKIVNDVDTEVYIGGTCKKWLSDRMSEHRKSAKKNGQSKFYKHMIDIGISHFKIELVENYPCKNQGELDDRENDIINNIGTLNTIRPGAIRRAGGRNSYRKDYYKNFPAQKNANKKWNNKIIECECGKTLKQSSVVNHKKSKGHKEFINNKGRLSLRDSLELLKMCKDVEKELEQ